MIMKFEPKEKIRVFNKVGFQKEKQYNHATYLGAADVPGNLLVDCSGNSYEVSSNDCYHWVKSDVDLVEFASQGIEKIFNYIQDAIEFQYNSDANFVTIEKTKNINEQDCVSVDDFKIYVEACYADIKDIDTIKEIPAWKLVKKISGKSNVIVGTSIFEIVQLLNGQIAELIYNKFWAEETLKKLSEEIKKNNIEIE